MVVHSHQRGIFGLIVHVLLFVQKMQKSDSGSQNHCKWEEGKIFRRAGRKTRQTVETAFKENKGAKTDP